MAKNSKSKEDVFTENLKGRNKPSDKDIQKATTNVEKEGEKGFHIKFPISHFDKLTEVSKSTHIPKKYVIMQALQEYYKNHDL